MSSRDQSRWGFGQWGYNRWGVLTPRWENQIRKVGRSYTRRVACTNVDIDTETGQRITKFSQEETVYGVLVQQNRPAPAFLGGTVVTGEAQFYTVEAFFKNDQLYDPVSEEYWSVLSIRPETDPENGGFAFRVLTLRRLPFYKIYEAPSTTPIVGGGEEEEPPPPPPPPPPATLFDECDSLTPGNGDWFIDDDWYHGSTLTIDTTDKKSGTGCLDLKLTTGTWNAWIYKWPPGGLWWDLSTNNEISFWIKPIGALPPELRFTIQTGEPSGSEWNGHLYCYLADLGLTLNVWNQVTVDLRKDINGDWVPDDALKMVRQIAFWMRNALTAYEFKIDLFEYAPGIDVDTGTLTATATVNAVASPFLLEIPTWAKVFSAPITAKPLLAGAYTLNGRYGKELDADSVVITDGVLSTKTFTFTNTHSATALHTHTVGVDKGKIHNVAEDTIQLQGVNASGFLDFPSGWWLNTNTYEPAEMLRHLKTMKSWGLNCVRLMICAGWWLDDDIVFQGVNYLAVDGRSYRDNLELLVDYADALGMYVQITPWNCIPIGEAGGGAQTTIPVTGYLKPLETPILANTAAYVTFMESLATRLGAKDNVIFECWNEPVALYPDGSWGNKTDWYAALTSAITAMRTITQNIITVQKDWCSVANLVHLHADNWIEALQAVPYSLGAIPNIVYTTHIYRHPVNDQTFGGMANTDYASIAALFEPLRSMKVDYGYPILINEGGPYLPAIRPDEYAAYYNLYTFLNTYGIGYIPWVWRPGGDNVYPLIISRTTLDPDAGGICLLSRVNI